MWIGGFGVLVAAPALLWSATAPPEPLWMRLSVVTGLLALSALVCAAVLPGRIRSLNRLFGIESVIEVHRFLGGTAAILVLLHLACVVAADPANVALLDPTTDRPAARAGTAALVATVALVGLALLRRRLRLSYAAWRWTHIALGGAVIIASVLHIWMLQNLVRDAVMGTVLVLIVGVGAVSGVYRWVWRTMLDPTTEFVVRDVRTESPSVSTLVLGPRGGRHAPGSWTFAPGQFAWLRLQRGPTAEEHPFTIASSAHLDGTEFTIRHTGDFTRSLCQLPPGSPVWVDGPHGAFTSDIGSCRGFVLIAGGVGITPMMSMLRTAADRADRRPYRMVVVAGSPQDLLFREELGFLRDSLDLRVTEVLRRSFDGWDGHTGDLGVGLLSLVIGTVDHPEDLDYFICGPPGIVEDALDVLDVLDVAPARIHTELFDFV